MNEALFIRTPDGLVLTDAGRADIRQALAEYLASCEIPNDEWPGIVERWKARGGSNLDLEREVQQWLSDHGRVMASATSPYIDDETLARVAKRFRRKAIGDDRVNAHLDRLDQRDAQKAATPSPTRKAKAKAPEKLPWTQPELDAAIRSDIEKHADMIANAKKGKAGAKREAQKFFGRNAVVKRLGVKEGSAGLVSKSKPWLELADAIGLRRKSGRGAKVGLNIALEQKADADDSSVAAVATSRETEARIQAAIESATGKKEKEGFVVLLDKFTRGEVTDDQAREIVATLQGE